MSDTLVDDIDPIETQDWLSAVDSLIRAEGAERAHYIINHHKLSISGIRIPPFGMNRIEVNADILMH